MATIVHGVGTKTAKIVLIGEAPGRREEQRGEPFVGPSGQRLNHWLRCAGIRRDECYLDNVVRVRPPNDNFNVFYESKNVPGPLLIQERERIKDLLLQMKPNVICALGNEALKTFTGHSGILSWRGSILPTEFGKVIPVIHPAFVLRTFEWNPLCIFDLKKAKREAISPFYAKPYTWEDLKIPRTCQEAIDFLTDFKDHEFISIDIETLMHTDYITHFGFAPTPHIAISIPLANRRGISLWTPSEESRIWQAIQELCSGPAKKIVQNSTFDIPILNKMGIYIENLWMDTMIAHVAVYPEIPKALNVQTSIYTDIPYYYELKEHGDREYCQYNALDCLATYRCAMKILKQLKVFGTEDFYFHNLHPLLGPAIDMQERGIRCDMKARGEERDNLQRRREELQAKFEAIIGHPLNANSPTKIAKFLYEEKGLPPVINRKTGKPTTNEAALDSLARKYDLPELDLIQQLRHLTKLLGTCYENTLDPDNRIRCSWNIAGAKTGRWSSTLTHRNTGMDIQNVPIEERRQFIPDEGKILIYADLKQADDMVVAWDSGDSLKKKLFKEGKDTHREDAAYLLGYAPEDVPRILRQVIKHIKHAANYCVGPTKCLATFRSKGALRRLKHAARGVELEKGVELTIQEVTRLLNAYYGRYLGIQIWHRKVEEQIRKTATLTTPMGRKRTFFGRLDDSTFRKAIAHTPSSTVADVLNIGIVNLHRALPEGAELLMQGHDAILAQCFPEQKEQVCQIIKRSMEMEIMGDLTIPVEIQEGKTWADIEDVELDEDYE